MTDPTESVAAWLEALAAPVPAPGGGAAAALVLAVAAATAQMAAGYAPSGVERERILAETVALRAAALSAGARDARASATLVAAFRGGTEAERSGALGEATRAALAVAEAALPLVPVLEWLRAHGDPRLRADVAVSAHLAAGAVRAAAATVRDNLDAAAADDPGMRHRLAAVEEFARTLDAASG